MRGPCPSPRPMKLHAWDTWKGLWVRFTAPAYGGKKSVTWFNPHFTFLIYFPPVIFIKCNWTPTYFVLSMLVFSFLLISRFLLPFLVRYLTSVSYYYEYILALLFFYNLNTLSYESIRGPNRPKGWRKDLWVSPWVQGKICMHGGITCPTLVI